MKKRGHSVREVIDTELMYLSQLETISTLYIQPLQHSTSPVISPQDAEAIFSNIEQLHQLNSRFAESLQQTVEYFGGDYGHVVVGNVFLEFIPYFKMYTEYVHNQETSSRTVKKCAKSSAVKKFFDANEQNVVSQGLDIESLLITPVQRIPRYKLLLETVLKYTPDNHPDKKLIPECLAQLEIVLESINQAAKEAEEYFALLNLEKQFRDGINVNLAIYGRKLIKCGNLAKEGNSGATMYTFFLFNDLLVYCHGNGSVLSLYVIHSRIPINEKFSFRDAPDNEGKFNRIAILSVQKSFVIQAQNEADKLDWLKAFSEAQSTKNRVSIENDEKSDEEEIAPLWESNSASKVCSICTEEFGVIRRRHHCRKCGKLVCGSCSENEMIIKKKSKKAERVCDTCFSMSQNKIEFDFSSFKHVGGIDSRNFGNEISNSMIAAHSEVNDEDSGDELIDYDSWYKVIMNYKGSASDQEMTIIVGNIVSIQFQDPSGFWFGVNLSTNEVGWVDPGMLEKVTISSNVQQSHFEYSLQKSMQVNKGNQQRPKNKPQIPQKKVTYSNENSPSISQKASFSSSSQKRVVSVSAPSNKPTLTKPTKVLANSAGSSFSKTLGNTTSGISLMQAQMYKVISVQNGNVQTEEIQLNIGDIINIVEKHESGYWYGENRRNGASGWLDPIHLEPI